jgi:branched-chain amino acid transport system substrate-binding protein
MMGAAVVGLSLVAAACGGDDGGTDQSTAGTVDEGVRSGIAEAGSSGSGGEDSEPAKPQPTSMADWEKLWEEERAAMVAEINDGDFGLSADNTTLTGPGGLTVDLSTCPAGWSNTEGLSDTEIKIGQAIAQSGTLADYGNIAKAMQVMFDDVNAAGGITDATGKARKITYIVKDDGYDATRTIPLVDELIDSEKVFMVVTLGSPNTMKTYDKLNERCIPQPLSMTGHPAWGDPEGHPWTTGMQLAYNTEAVLWGSFIEQRLDELAPDGGDVTVAALIMNNDFGKSYDGGFKSFLDQSPVKDRINYVSETIEPQAPTITDAMTTLAANDPHVFIAMVAGTPCTQAIVEAANNGMKESTEYLFQPSVCSASSFVGSDKVGGDYADGWWIVNGGLKDITSPAFEDDAAVQHAREELTAAGIDYKASGSFSSGYVFGWPIVQALFTASQFEGGLSRTNFINAWRAMDMTHPYLLEGVRFNMNGAEDPYLVEGGVYQTRDAAGEKWDNEGDVIDLSGESSPCAWDQAAGVCA